MSPTAFVVDPATSDKQVEALSQIFTGQLGGLPWELLGPTFQVAGLVKAKITVEGSGRKSTFRIEGVGEGRGDTLKNPVTGEDHIVNVDLPTGFIWKKGEAGQGSFRASAAGVDVAFDKTNWIFTGDGDVQRNRVRFKRAQQRRPPLPLRTGTAGIMIPASARARPRRHRGACAVAPPEDSRGRSWLWCSRAGTSWRRLTVFTGHTRPLSICLARRSAAASVFALPVMSRSLRPRQLAGASNP